MRGTIFLKAKVQNEKLKRYITQKKPPSGELFITKGSSASPLFHIKRATRDPKKKQGIFCRCSRGGAGTKEGRQVPMALCYLRHHPLDICGIFTHVTLCEKENKLYTVCQLIWPLEPRHGWEFSRAAAKNKPRRRQTESCFSFAPSSAFSAQRQRITVRGSNLI